MKLKKTLGIMLLLLIFGIVAAVAYDYCFVVDGVTISKNGTYVIFENKADSYRTVVYTVVFTDGTTREREQYTVSANSTERKGYGKRIKDVDPCLNF
jgi:hypothetical protein